MPVRRTAPIALTMGEPGGVGPELALAAHARLRNTGPVFFIIADPTLFGERGSSISNPDAASATFKRALPVLTVEKKVRHAPGVALAENAAAVVESIDRAVAFATAGMASAVVTNPIQKATLRAGGFSFPGHTEYLEHLAQGLEMPNERLRGAVMMLAGPDLKTVPLTIHQSVIEAARSLRPDLIVRKAQIVDEALRFDFGIANPRLAISGLNPHAGEAGTMGVEDDMIIAPAIEMLKARGVNARGPLPADTMFHEEARLAYDAALCMLHDQALIPAKTLAFHQAVNVTLGLPIIRTSPDHGTALDIAGQGRARPDSLIAAINLAAAMAETRRQS